MSDPITRLNAALESRYRIERELGEGGMATVYLADDLRHERKVALKVLRPELAAVVGAERFLGEIKTTASLQHPHILPLHDSGDADGFLFYVMPYVEGETLRERMNRERQLPVDEAVRIASNVAEALDYAHARGVIHRDVKPANVLLQAGKPVISDFGIALAVSAGGAERLTETGLSLGTPHYMSPEQATGDQGVGPPSDIYALGCVLYEMLLGEPPYQGGTAQAILGKIITATPDRVTERRPSVPANVDAAIRRALEKVPADRFGSSADFARALGDPGFRHGQVEAARAAAAAGPWRLAAMVMGAIALAVTVTLGWVLFARDSPPQPVIRSTLVLPEGDWLGEANVNAPVLDVSDDGGDVVYIGRREGVDRLYHRPLGRDDATQIADTDGVQDPFFSPDGRWVGFFAAGQLRKVLLGGGGLPVTVTRVTAIPHGAVWGADDFIYFGQHASGIWRVAADGGTPEPVTTLDANGGIVDHRAPDVLPGGRAVLFQRNTNTEGTSWIAVRRLDTGEQRDLVIGGTPRYSSTGHLVFARGTALWAVRFDPDRLETVGEPFSVIEGLWVSNQQKHFAFSGSGALVYVAGAGPETSTLVRVDLEGQPIEVLPAADFWLPRVSPDGNQVAVGIGPDIWAVGLDRPTRTNLTFGQTNRLYPFAWMPDSRHIAFASRSSDGLYEVAVDGSSEPELLLRGPGALTPFPTSWSRDGVTLAFYVTHPDSLRNVWTWATTDTEPVPFVVTEFMERAPRISPNGRWIAYVSDETGRDEIYLQPHPGPAGRYPVSTDGGTEPAWSPDGDVLYFRDGPAMMVVDVSTESALTIGIPRLLFADDRYALNPQGNANYDVLPDGTGFMMILGGGAPTELQVVQNWFQEVLERAPE